MSKTLYDEDGNPIELGFEPEQVKELQEKAKKAEELEKIVKEKEEELSKYESKDFNFSKLRKATKEKQEEMLKEFSTKEQTLIKEIADLRDSQEKYQQKNLEAYEEQVINAMVGGDEEMRNKLKEQAKEFVGTPMTEEEIFRRYKNAFTLVSGNQPKVNPINRFSPSSVDSVPKSKKGERFTDTEEGKEAYKKYFPDSPLNKEDK